MRDYVVKLERAARDVLRHRVGTLPRAGFIRDTDESRAAIGRLVQLIEAAEHLDRNDVLDAHAQFGRLDKESVKTAMGPNWPPEWDHIRDGIFEPAGIANASDKK